MILIPKGSSPENISEAKLLSLLQWRTAATEENRRGYWITIHSNELRAVIGGRYADTVRDLKAAAKLEVNERYSVHRFAKSYRLPRALRTWRCENFDARAKIHNRIRIDESDQVGLELVKRFPMFTIPRGTYCKGWNHFNARSIFEQRFYATRCPYGRFHSVFTGLPRSVRKRLRVEGSPVVEIDIRNCQPLILGLVMKHHDRTGDHQHHYRTGHTPLYHMSHKLDISEYLSLCTSGQIYEHLEAECKSAGMKLFDIVPRRLHYKLRQNREMNRQDIKKAFLVLLFANVSDTLAMPLFQLFHKLFPTIAEYIVDTKQNDHRQLAHRCQRFESAVMVGAKGVADRFIAEDASAPIVSIHDAIVTTRRKAELVREIIDERFQHSESRQR